MHFSLTKLFIFERNIFDRNGEFCFVLKENISIITNLILNVFQISIFVFSFYEIIFIIFISYVLNKLNISCFFLKRNDFNLILLNKYVHDCYMKIFVINLIIF